MNIKDIYYIEVLGSGDFLTESQLKDYLKDNLFKKENPFPISIVRIGERLSYYEGYKMASTLCFIKEYKEKVKSGRTPFDIMSKEGLQLIKNYNRNIYKSQEPLANFLF